MTGNLQVIKNAQLDWNDSGTPVSNQFDDVYFSNANGLEESRYVFIQQNHLPQRWQSFTQSRFVIAETGFGTGLNFLAVWQEFAAFRAENPQSPVTQLHFISFEKFPVHIDDLIKAHQAWPELAEYAKQLQQHYPLAIPECHRLVLADGMITLDLWFGDIHDSLPKLAQTDHGLVDAWFLDGFAPSKNKDMWNEDLFNHMAQLTKKDGTCATFTAAGFVRRGLIDAGFDMQKVKGFGTKREMIAGRLNSVKAFNNYAPWLQRYAMESSNERNLAIIGGGIASATLALALYRRGYSIDLYCEDPKPALGASGNRQGALYPLIAEPKSALNRFFAPAFLYARQLVKQASQQLNFDHDFCGVTQLAWSDKAKGKLDKMLLNDYPSELLQPLNADQTARAIGLEVDLDSIHYPLGGWLCPQQLTQALIYELEKQPNVNVYFDTRIEDLSFHSDSKSWTLSSSHGSTYTHPAVVVANGHQFSRFKQLKAIAATAVKGQVSHIPTTDTLKKLKTVLCYDGYMTPQNPSNGHHCIGASYDRNNIDNHFDAEAQVSNGERLKQCLPNQDWPNEVDTSGDLSRQGIRSVTRDHLPFVGNVFQFEPVIDSYAKLDPQILRKRSELMPEIPHYPNLFCMVGLGARGLCSAPLLSEVLASQIAGDPMPLPLEVLEKIHPARMWVRKMLKGRPITEE